MPCCCPATLIAATVGAPAAAHAALNAVHQLSGSCSLTGATTAGCDADDEAITSPDARSRISIFVDCVDESTPAMRGM